MNKKHILIVVLVVAAAASVLLVASHRAAYTEDAKQSKDAADADAVTTATAPPQEHEDEMKAAIDFIEKSRMGFLATVDEGMPRVRAFGIMKVESERLYFGTANTKDVFVQLKKTPYAEWIAMDPETYATLRVFGKVVFVDDIETRQEIIDSNPMIKKMYSGEKEKEFEVFYLEDIEFSWFGMPQAPRAAEGDAGQ